MISPVKPLPIDVDLPEGYSPPEEAIQLVAELLLEVVDQEEDGEPQPANGTQT